MHDAIDSPIESKSATAGYLWGLLCCNPNVDGTVNFPLENKNSEIALEEDSRILVTLKSKKKSKKNRAGKYPNQNKTEKVQNAGEMSTNVTKNQIDASSISLASILEISSTKQQVTSMYGDGNKEETSNLQFQLGSPSKKKNQLTILRKLMKKVLTCLILPVCFIVIGAIIFSSLEYSGEKKELELYSSSFQSLQVIMEEMPNSTKTIFNDYLSTVESYLYSKSAVPDGNSFCWDLKGSVSFSWTVITTIGYGTCAPSTIEGKIFCVLYTLLSVPLFLNSLSVVADIMNKVAHYLLSQTSLLSIFSKRGNFIIWMCGVLFLFLFSYAYSYLHSEWSYLDAVYFSIITLTTVGLGDYTPDLDGFHAVLFYVSCYAGMIIVASLISSIQSLQKQAINHLEPVTETAEEINYANHETGNYVQNEGVQEDLKQVEAHISNGGNIMLAASLRALLVGFILPTIFLLFGGFVFSYLEYPNEKEELSAHLESHLTLEKEISEITALMNHTTLKPAYDLFLETIDSYLNSGSNLPDEENPFWDIKGSAFFCWTIMTTIGYGTYGPSTTAGKAFCLLYTILSIPMFIVASEEVSCLLAKTAAKVNIKLQFVELLDHPCYKTALIWIFALLLLCLLSLVYDETEAGWTFIDGFYFMLITFSTVGFGDYAPKLGLWHTIVFIVYSYLGLVIISSVIATIQSLYEKKSETVSKRLASIHFHFPVRREALNKVRSARQRFVTARSVDALSC